MTNLDKEASSSHQSLPEVSISAEKVLQEEADFDYEKHLTEIRQRLIYVIVFFALASLVAFAFTPAFIRLLQGLAPKGTTFFQLKPGELFFTYLKVTCHLAVAASLPFALFQLKAFVWPGLKPQEQRVGGMLVYASPFLFFGGVAFAYFLALKPMLQFLLGFELSLG